MKMLIELSHLLKKGHYKPNYITKQKFVKMPRESFYSRNMSDDENGKISFIKNPDVPFLLKLYMALVVSPSTICSFTGTSGSLPDQHFLFAVIVFVLF